MSVSWKQIPWKKRLIQAVWILFGIGSIVLFGAAMQKKNQKNCAGVQVEIAGAAQNMFLDEKEIMQILNRSKPLVGASIGKTNLRALENRIENNSWIQNAEMYFDNRQVLQVKIVERQPVARVFLIDGGSFYVDSACLRLPLSDKISARVPVFTGFPSNKSVLAKPDSALLEGVVKLASFIGADSFWMAQIVQVNINHQANFELIPLIGDQLILLGDADNLNQKFNRLAAFYQQALLQQGISTYEKLDIRFDNQVVAIKRGSEKIWVDSVKANALLQQLVDKTPPMPEPIVVEKKAAVTKPIVPKDKLTKPKAVLPANKKIKIA